MVDLLELHTLSNLSMLDTELDGDGRRHSRYYTTVDPRS